MLPQVSIIIPTYNYANYILEAIDSIVYQTYPKKSIEIIVVDDGSSDNTREVLQSFIDNNSLQYYYQENKGKANATSFGIEKSIGKYIFNLDADDYFFPDKISQTVAIFEMDNSIVHVASPALCSKGKKWEGSIENIPEKLLNKSLNGDEVIEFFYNQHILFGGGSTYAARANVLKQINIPDGTDMYIDEFLILAIFPKGNTYFINKPLSVWRIHSSNYSGSNTSIEKKIAKGRRLLNSSVAVLDYLLLNKNLYSFNIVKIYQLIHLTREISFKQELDKKTILVIIEYTYQVFVKLRVPLLIAKKYFVFNMLLPTPLHRILKHLKNKLA